MSVPMVARNWSRSPTAGRPSRGADLLHDCRRRGMTKPAVGAGAPGFRNAVREVFPATGEQRCWFMNRPISLPRSLNHAPAALEDMPSRGQGLQSRLGQVPRGGHYGRWPAVPRARWGRDGRAPGSRLHRYHLRQRRRSVPMVFITCARARRTRLCQRSPPIFHVSRGSP